MLLAASDRGAEGVKMSKVVIRKDGMEIEVDVKDLPSVMAQMGPAKEAVGSPVPVPEQTTKKDEPKTKPKTKKWSKPKPTVYPERDGVKTVTCAVCGHTSGNIGNKHIAKHGLTVEGYRREFRGRDVVSKDLVERMLKGKRRADAARAKAKTKQTKPAKPKKTKPKSPAPVAAPDEAAAVRVPESWTKPRPPAEPEVTAVDPRDLYVSNLPYEATETDVEDLFSQFGEVLQTKILYDPTTGVSKGRAFVRMANPQDTTIVLKRFNDGQYVFLGGRHVYVNRAATKPYNEREK